MYMSIENVEENGNPTDGAAPASFPADSPAPTPACVAEASGCAQREFTLPVQIGDSIESINIEQLKDPEFFMSRRAELVQAESPPKIYLEGVFSFPDDLRMLTFKFLASLETVQYFSERTGAPSDSLF